MNRSKITSYLDSSAALLALNAGTPALARTSGTQHGSDDGHLLGPGLGATSRL